MQDVYTQTYRVRETMFSNQTGQFPTHSQRGNKYIMVMVEINSNTIIVEPMKSRKDEEMIHVYNTLLLRLKRAGTFPKKHVLNIEVSENTKNHIRDTCKFNMELVPPGWVSPTQCNQGGHTQLQSPFPQRPGGRSQQFPPKPMGSAPPTNQDHDVPHPTI